MTERLQKMRSPTGIASWPKLNTPDTKFNDDGVFSVRLLLDPDDEEAAQFIGELEELADRAVEVAQADNPKKKTIKRADPPFKDEVDRDTDEPTGKIAVNFKMYASGRNKQTGETWEKRPKLYDASGNLLPRAVMVGGGSEIKVSFMPSFWYTPQLGAGVSLRMRAVQVLKLVTPGGTFEDEFSQEDGFVYEPEPAEQDIRVDEEETAGGKWA